MAAPAQQGQEPSGIAKSPGLTASLERAHRLAAERGHGMVTLEHVLLALTDDADAGVVFGVSPMDPQRLKGDLGEVLKRVPPADGPGRAIMPNGDLLRVLRLAATAAQQSNRTQIDGMIVLAAIIGDGKTAGAQLLQKHGLTFNEVIRVLQGGGQGAAAPAAQAPQAGPPPQTGQPPQARSGSSGMQASPPQTRVQAAAPAAVASPVPEPVSERSPPMAAGPAVSAEQAAPVRGRDDAPGDDATRSQSTDELLASVRARLKDKAPQVPPPIARASPPVSRLPEPDMQAPVPPPVVPSVVAPVSQAVSSVAATRDMQRDAARNGDRVAAAQKAPTELPPTPPASPAPTAVAGQAGDARHLGAAGLGAEGLGAEGSAADDDLFDDDLDGVPDEVVSAASVVSRAPIAPPVAAAPSPPSIVTSHTAPSQSTTAPPDAVAVRMPPRLNAAPVPLSRLDVGRSEEAPEDRRSSLRAEGPPSLPPPGFGGPGAGGTAGSRGGPPPLPGQMPSVAPSAPRQPPVQQQLKPSAEPSARDAGGRDTGVRGNGGRESGPALAPPPSVTPASGLPAAGAPGPSALALPAPMVDLAALADSLPERLRKGQVTEVEVSIPRQLFELAGQMPSPRPGFWPPLRVISLRLSGNDDAVIVEPMSPPIVWARIWRGPNDSENLTWRWRIVPRKSGTIGLSLWLGVRMVAPEGVGQETLWPEETVGVRVKSGRGRRLAVGALFALAILGGAAAALVYTGKADVVINGAQALWSIVRGK